MGALELGVSNKIHDPGPGMKQVSVILVTQNCESPTSGTRSYAEVLRSKCHNPEKKVKGIYLSRRGAGIEQRSQ